MCKTVAKSVDASQQKNKMWYIRQIEVFVTNTKIKKTRLSRHLHAYDYIIRSQQNDHSPNVCIESYSTCQVVNKNLKSFSNEIIQPTRQPIYILALLGAMLSPNIPEI